MANVGRERDRKVSQLLTLECVGLKSQKTEETNPDPPQNPQGGEVMVVRGGVLKLPSLSMGLVWSARGTVPDPKTIHFLPSPSGRRYSVYYEARPKYS